MQIREIKKSDIKALARLLVEVYNAPPWNDKWTEETAISSLNSLINFPNFHGNVLVENSNIKGAILGHIRTYSEGNTYYIDEMFLASDIRRKGLATQLYQHTINSLDITGMFFTTLKDSPAYYFYKKQGAIELGDSACFYQVINK